MKTLFPLIALVVLSSSLLFSCKKNELHTKTDFLTNGGWYPGLYEFYQGDTAFVPIPLENCEKDNGYFFSKDNSASFTVGVRCDSTEKNENGHWAFWKDETILAIVIDTQLDTMGISRLDANSMVLTSIEKIGSTIYKSRITFHH